MSAEEETAAPAPTGRLSYGWAVVAAVFVMLGFSAGLGFYGTSVYLRAFVVEQGLAVGAVSVATATFFVVGGATGLPIARLLDRYDPRITVVTGAVVGGAALALLGQVTALWQLFFVYALLGVGFAGTALVPATTIVTRWFAERRSVALAVASSGLSVGGMVLTPLVATAVARHGLAVSAPWIGLAYAVGIAPVALAVLRPAPAERAAADPPEGAIADTHAAPSGGEPAASSGTPFRAALATRFFVLVTLAYVLVMFAQVGGVAHHVNLVSGRVGEAQAALAVSLLAGTSVVARLTGGWVVTRLSLRGVTVTLMVLQCGALLILATSESYAGLLVGTVALGTTMGNLLMFHPLLLADAFGVRDYSRIYALSQFVMTLGLALGPSLIGLVHDAVGGYALPLGLTATVSLLAAAALVAAGPTGAAAPAPADQASRAALR